MLCRRQTLFFSSPSLIDRLFSHLNFFWMFWHFDLLGFVWMRNCGIVEVRKFLFFDNKKSRDRQFEMLIAEIFFFSRKNNKNILFLFLVNFILIIWSFHFIQCSSNFFTKNLISRSGLLCRYMKSHLTRMIFNLIVCLKVCFHE